MQDELNVFYFQITDVWKKLCEEHNLLLERTFDEYELLLSNRIEELEVKIQEKVAIIESIKNLEGMRSDLIEKINTKKELFKIKDDLKDIHELVKLMEIMPQEKENHHLRNFNSLLISIIEKIQDQNKKNQIFINKAIVSIQNLKTETLGTRYETYKANGSKSASTS